MEGTKKVWKLFSEWNYEEEQAWLNEMVDQGWLLKKVSTLGAKFEFEACEPGVYALGMMKLEQNDPRIAELTAEGAEVVTTHDGWHYFCKKKADGELVLFRDIDAQIAHIDMLMKEMIAAECLTIVMMVALDTVIVSVILLGFLLYFLGRMKTKKDKLLQEKEQLKKETDEQA